MRRAVCQLAVVACLVALIATKSAGQSPVITSLQGNGQLSWTNMIITNAVYRLEWASRLDGVWHSFTYQPINTIDAHDKTVFEVEVPMFYRVVMETNEPPAGAVWIDAGTFAMGDSLGVGWANELPVHTTFVSGFWMDAMEVTKAQWDAVRGWGLTNGYTDLPAGAGKASNHPVQTVGWYGCVKWCNARSEKEGYSPVYFTNDTRTAVYRTGTHDVSSSQVAWTAKGYRLPTEAEWEKAARGGRQGRQFPWGRDTIQHAWANYLSTNTYAYDTSPTRGFHPVYNDGAPPFTSPAGSFSCNAYGLYDMAGNVWEWCWDLYDAGYYSVSPATNPHGPITGTIRVLRGGAWSHDALGTRVSVRNVLSGPATTNYLHGFRPILPAGQ
jgi:formylglycine-generating enzyme required for sulfatase activity